MENIRTKVRAFLNRFIQNVQIEDDQDIFASGFVSSLFAMQLVLFIENEFDLSIEREDLNMENFRTVNTISNLVDRKLRLIQS